MTETQGIEIPIISQTDPDAPADEWDTLTVLCGKRRIKAPRDDCDGCKYYEGYTLGVNKPAIVRCTWWRTEDSFLYTVKAEAWGFLLLIAMAFGISWFVLLLPLGLFALIANFVAGTTFTISWVLGSAVWMALILAVFIITITWRKILKEV